MSSIFCEVVLDRDSCLYCEKEVNANAERMKIEFIQYGFQDYQMLHVWCYEMWKGTTNHAG